MKRTSQNHRFFIMKQDFSQLVNYLCNMCSFAFYIALYDKRKVHVGCHTLIDHRNLTIDHGIVMYKSWKFVSYFLWEPWCDVRPKNMCGSGYRTYPNILPFFLSKI